MKRKVHPFRCLRWKQSFLIRWLRMFFLPPTPPNFKVEGRTRRTCRNDCFFRRTKPMMKKQHLTTLMSGGAGGMFLSLRAWLFLSQTPVESCRFICSLSATVLRKYWESYTLHSQRTVYVQSTVHSTVKTLRKTTVYGRKELRVSLN